MSQRVLGPRIGLGVLLLAVYGCGGGSKAATTTSAGGNAGSATTGGGAGGAAAGTTFGGMSAGGAAAGAAMGGAGRVQDPGLKCPPPTMSGNYPIGLPCNGQCLLEPGDENAGCRVLHRGFDKTSLVVDGDTIFISDTSTAAAPSPLGGDDWGETRIAIIDRVSLAVTGEVMSAGHEFVRAVSPTQLAWYEVVDSTTSLHVANRATGMITESQTLASGFSLKVDSNPREGVWFQGDSLYYTAEIGWGPALRKVPLAGGEPIEIGGIARGVVDISKLLVIGNKDQFDFTLHLLQLSDSAAPAWVGAEVRPSNLGGQLYAADATHAYVLELTGSTGWDLYRTPLDGAATEKVTHFPAAWDTFPVSGGFVAWDKRYLWLYPASGAAPQKLADLGQANRIESLVMTPTHLFANVKAGPSPSDYLIEIKLP